MPVKDSIKLKTVCLKIGSGATPRGGKEAYKGGATALIRSQNIYNDGFRKDGVVYIDDTQASELKNVEVLNGDVLLNITGDSVARCCQVSTDILPARVNQHVAIIRPDPRTLDARYLHYILVSNKYQEQLLSLASAGATRPALTKLMIENLEVHLPHLAEQKRIAGILGALDDKIELNRKMNETLEQMTRALFKSWFVDFDPVHAKAAGRQPAGMDKATADLFPDSFVDSELGKMPKGWGISMLGEDVTITRGCSYKSEDLASSSTAMVTLKSFKRGGGYRHDGLKSYTGAYKPAQVVHTGELVVSYTDVTQAAELIGRPAIVSTTPDFKQLVISQDVSVVRPKNSTPISYLYGLMMEESFRAHTYAHSTGTTVLHLSSTALPSFKFIKPKIELLAAFDKTAANLLKLADENHQQSRLLSATRDALLPKLLSGALVPKNA